MARPEDTSESESQPRRVDLGGVTLVWGNASQWKAELREESLRWHLDAPLAERLRAAFAMVVPRPDR